MLTSYLPVVDPSTKQIKFVYCPPTYGTEKYKEEFGYYSDNRRVTDDAEDAAIFRKLVNKEKRNGKNSISNRRRR